MTNATVYNRHTSLAELAARKTGQPQHLREPGSRPAATRGHSATEPGLRAHSVDEETFPWRIVGGYYNDTTGQLRDKWSVVGADGITIANRIEIISRHGQVQCSSGEACALAHQLARALKRQYPEGYIPEGRNLGGPIETLAERLAGCVIRVQENPDHGGRAILYAIDRKPRGSKTLFGRRLDDHRTLCAFDAEVLATSPRVSVAVVSLPDRHLEGDDHLVPSEAIETRALAHRKA